MSKPNGRQCRMFRSCRHTPERYAREGVELSNSTLADQVSAMTELRTLALWLRRFLVEHIVTRRGLARNTQKIYRDTFALLLPFVSSKIRKSVDRLAIQDLTAAGSRPQPRPACRRRHLGAQARAFADAALARPGGDPPRRGARAPPGARAKPLERGAADSPDAPRARAGAADVDAARMPGSGAARGVAARTPGSGTRAPNARIAGGGVCG